MTTFRLIFNVVVDTIFVVTVVFLSDYTHWLRDLAMVVVIFAIYYGKPVFVARLEPKSGRAEDVDGSIRKDR